MLLVLAQVDLREKLNIPDLNPYVLHKIARYGRNLGFMVVCVFFVLKSGSNSTHYCNRRVYKKCLSEPLRKIGY